MLIAKVSGVVLSPLPPPLIRTYIEFLIRSILDKDVGHIPHNKFQSLGRLSPRTSFTNMLNTASRQPECFITSLSKKKDRRDQ